jgi:hypothetical protein
MPTVPQGVSEFDAALNAWQIGVAGWLGLDTATVFDLEVDHVEHRGVTIRWTSTERQTLSRRPQQESARWNGSCAVFSSVLTLDTADSEAFVAATGNRPQLLTSEELERIATIS